MQKATCEPPTHGFSVCLPENTSKEKTNTYRYLKQQGTEERATQNPKSDEIDTPKLSLELTKIISVWHELPKHIKEAIRLLVKPYDY